MTLSACLVTRGGPETVTTWIAMARAFASEIVVAVDREAPVGALDAARRHADQVLVVELDGSPNPAYGWVAAHANGDWVLFLDDDETLPPAFAGRLPELAEDRRYTHYHFPVRWLVARPHGRLGYLDQFPWSPNLATRMFRNAGGLARHAPNLHSTWEVYGEGRAVVEEATTIDHTALLRPRAEREAKVARYQACSGPGVPVCAEYYLYEDYLDDVAVAPLPAPRARDRLRAASPRSATAVRAHATLAELLDHAAASGDDPPIWSARYLAHTTPTLLGANRGYTVEVTVANTSRAPWRSLGQVNGRVLLSYRWFDGEGAPVIPQGDITLLPRTVAPGEVSCLRAGLWTPPQPGRYRLEWDMLCERVAWFSTRGVRPLPVFVDVADLGARPASRHFAHLEVENPR